jgi:hypothetical protein
MKIARILVVIAILMGVANVYRAHSSILHKQAVTGDSDGSGIVDFTDFLAFAAAFGQSAAGDNATFNLDGSGGSIEFGDFLVFAAAFGQSSSEDGSGDTVTGRVNIRDFVSAERSGDCADYAWSSTAAVLDIQNARNFDGLVDIEPTDSKCTISSNAIPNHVFNDESAQFAHDVSELETTWEITRSPEEAASTTAIELSSYDGILLNGVVLDLLAAGCFGVGDGRIGCGDLSAPYRYDPMSPSANFGTDGHNAHTQPDGRYHYHGDPLAMYGEATLVSSVVGFAADGYPIYGPYFSDGTTIREAASGFALRSGERTGGPGGAYDGTFFDDYEFTGSGDLDECNGVVVDGQYGYYVTRTYPWVLGCLRGTADPSFQKRR